MRKYITLFSILLFTFVSRVFFLGSIPPIAHIPNAIPRYVSLASLLGSVILLYILVGYGNKDKKPALLSSFIFSVLFWTFSESRVVSEPNHAVFLILFILVIISRVQRKLIKTSLFFLLCLFLRVVYPSVWIFKMKFLPELSLDILKNFYTVISPEFIFFRNIYFWWGAVRDFGLINLAFLPFLSIGFFQSIYQKKWKIVLAIFGIAAFTSFSPFFPETREFYLATPIFAVLISRGILRMYLLKSKMAKIFFIACVFFFMYELSTYYHFYTVHFKQEVSANISKIHEAF